MNTIEKLLIINPFRTTQSKKFTVITARLVFPIIFTSKNHIIFHDHFFQWRVQHKRLGD